MCPSIWALSGTYIFLSSRPAFGFLDFFFKEKKKPLQKVTFLCKVSIYKGNPEDGCNKESSFISLQTEMKWQPSVLGSSASKEYYKFVTFHWITMFQDQVFHLCSLDCKSAPCDISQLTMLWNQVLNWWNSSSREAQPFSNLSRKEDGSEGLQGSTGNGRRRSGQESREEERVRSRGKEVVYCILRKHRCKDFSTMFVLCFYFCCQ